MMTKTTFNSEIDALIKGFAESKLTKAEKIAKLNGLVEKMKSIGIPSNACDDFKLAIMFFIDPDFKNAVSDMVYNEIQNIGPFKSQNVVTTFTPGLTYYTRSVCDHDCIFKYTIISRTTKSVVIRDNEGKTRTCRIKVYEGVEQIAPEGRYSMCPIVGADRIYKHEPVLRLVG